MRRIYPLLALGLALAGCGGTVKRPSSPGGLAGPPGATPGPPSPWLIPTGSAPPSVAAENRRAGSGGWRLPGAGAQVGGARRGDVAGYVSRPSVSAGESESIFVSAPGAGFARIGIWRIGWYGGRGGREVLRTGRLRLVPQPPCAHSTRTGLTVCRWHPTVSFRIPSALASGVYVGRLSTRGGASDVLFVVRSRRPGRLLAILPTPTYEAYNAWGGDSLYPGGADRVGATGTTQGVAVAYARPYDSITGAGQFFARDVAMVRFLERYGYPVTYTTGESVDGDPEQLAGARAILDFGHSEYWSAREAAAVAAARDRGTNLVFVSSDTLAWRVRFGPGPAPVMVAYKEHAALDPVRDAPSGEFPGRGAGLTGSAYLGCITRRLSVPGPPVYRYASWSPVAGLRPAWLFRGSGVRSGTAIAGIVGYELDQRTALSPAGTELIGGGAAACMPAEPGEPSPGPGQDRAETTLLRARSGAMVFATGTLGWELGLDPVPSASPDAPRAPVPAVVRITRNVLDRFLGG